jgi:hypothetical protein
MSQVTPFHVDWSEAAVGEVLDRIRAFPWPATCWPARSPE